MCINFAFEFRFLNVMSKVNVFPSIVTIPNPVPLVVVVVGRSFAPFNVDDIVVMPVVARPSTTGKNPGSPPAGSVTVRVAVEATFIHVTSSRLIFFWTIHGPVPPVQVIVMLLPERVMLAVMSPAALGAENKRNATTSGFVTGSGEFMNAFWL